MRGLLGRGAVPRGRNTSDRRATRPVAFVRIRLRTSGIVLYIWEEGGKEGDTHPTTLDIG
jgi:hypothetical protein